MANFRSRLLLFVGVPAVFAGLAGAQTLTCTTGDGGPAVPPAGTPTAQQGWYGTKGSPGNGTLPTQPIELRSEGATELLSDTIFNCDGTPIALQGQVTAYVAGSVPGLSLTGTFPILQIIDNTAGGHTTQIYQGVTVPGTQQVIFGTLGVGQTVYTTGAVVFPNYNFVLEISNVRVNVTGLLNPTLPTPVTEQVFAGSEGVATLFQSNPIVVGYVLKSLNVSVTPVQNYVVCLSSAQQSVAPTYLTYSFSVNVSELFAGAFKTALTPAPTVAIPYPANIPGGEQGTFPGVGGIEATPLGTRIKFVIANIPAGVTGVTVPNAISGNGTPALEVDLVTGGDTGTAAPAGTLGSSTLAVTSGSVTVIYQVNTEDLASIKTFSFQPLLNFAANAVIGAQPAVTITTSYAPSPATPGGALTVPTTYLPYFANTGTALLGSLWNVCETDLLFPFVSTVGGFETGIAIANASLDPFGTTGQPGACNLYYYGTGAVPAIPYTNPPTYLGTTTGLPASIAIGTVGTTTSSPYVGTNFTGYVIARCQFLFAHGYGFILGSTGFAPGSAAGASALTGGTYFTQGYEALVLPAGPKARIATNPAPAPAGAENLNQ